MDSGNDQSDEVASTLLSNRPLMEKYANIERIFYGLDPTALADFMHLVQTRIAEKLPGGTRTTVESELYDESFYDWVRLGAQKSAAVIVPLLVKLIRPQSVVDVGCGDGTWLAAFLDAGVGRIRGFDGEWVDRSRLAIPAASFRAVDLSAFQAGPEERYDLALSVECAEHLSSDSAERFVRNLCGMAPVVCFSAAVPFQGGAGHVNEQWPEYWARLFKRFGYDAVDWLRPKIWSNPEVESWYAQNLMLYADESAVEHYPSLLEYRDQTDPNALSRIHPAHYLKVVMFTLPEVARQGMT